MVANNYVNEGRSHTEVIELLALGFTGKLLQWWNNCLTEESKEDIKHVQKDEEGLPIFDESRGKGIPDGVNILIYTIMKHFIGKPSNITSRIYDPKRGVSYRQCGSIKRREPAKAICVHENKRPIGAIWLQIKTGVAITREG